MKYILYLLTFICLNTCKSNFEEDKKINPIIVKHIKGYLDSNEKIQPFLKKAFIVAFFDINSSSTDTNVVFFSPITWKKGFIHAICKYYIPVHFEEISPKTGILIIERKNPFFDNEEIPLPFEKIINDYTSDTPNQYNYLLPQRLFLFEGKIVKIKECTLEENPFAEIIEKYVKSINPMPIIPR